MPSVPPNFAAEIGLLVARVARLWRREADQALADHGLSQATAHPLRALARHGTDGKGIRQGALAEDVGIEGPSLVRLIDLLQAEKLVERREDPSDRRAKTLHLTAKGASKATEIEGVLRDVREDLLKGIPAEDLATAYDVLHRIEQRMTRLHEAIPPDAGPAGEP
ncbi:putative transcriptional regulatory protein slyA-like, MarR family [Bradyrhizobium sp. ORS 285]|uniref:MarR family winged helix-turn-helix transcriptional regulator n=1 Tax=Bradyrhizobium sp. ORS 285 TaxID=115808 RepID=UPI0002407809|nr:MarR family transcriptional regulator [Bradyrhizobium sp. ORS 285]CCD83787.1 putative transcriptional regulatory protein slyA-like, MarR family [Bradyrhizobium sp. ORS 285]SMX59330.1 putative transcriptional regulatory protein slyA-like, MarR family [Bradyrhizobium sp. ORS 285]